MHACKHRQQQQQRQQQPLFLLYLFWAQKKIQTTTNSHLIREKMESCLEIVYPFYLFKDKMLDCVVNKFAARFDQSFQCLREKISEDEEENATSPPPKSINEDDDAVDKCDSSERKPESKLHKFESIRRNTIEQYRAFIDRDLTDELEKYLQRDEMLEKIKNLADKKIINDLNESVIRETKSVDEWFNRELTTLDQCMSTKLDAKELQLNEIMSKLAETIKKNQAKHAEILMTIQNMD